MRQNVVFEGAVMQSILFCRLIGGMVANIRNPVPIQLTEYVDG